MGTKGRWRTWLVGALLVCAAFALAWWNNPANAGSEREAQRAWLALGYSSIVLVVFVPILALRARTEVVAQRTLIVFVALLIALAVWWVGYLPSDPFGCSRVDAPDCHTTSATRWRALAEGLAMYALVFGATHAMGSLIERRRPHPR